MCSRCGALHGSEARFCPSCGTPVHGPRAIAEVGEAVSLPGGDAAPPPQPATPPPPAQPLVPAPLQPQPVAPEPPAAASAAPRRARARARGAARSRRPAAARRRRAPRPAADGEQPTEVMRALDEQPGATAGNGDAEAVAQPTGEPREP